MWYLSHTIPVGQQERCTAHTEFRIDFNCVIVGSIGAKHLDVVAVSYGTSSRLAREVHCTPTYPEFMVDLNCVRYFCSMCHILSYVCNSVDVVNIHFLISLVKQFLHFSN